MAKEPFDRTKPPVNIGEIGKTPTNEDAERAGATIAFVMQNGEEEGKRIFGQMILQADQMNEEVQNIDDGIESKTR